MNQEMMHATLPVPGLAFERIRKVNGQGHEYWSSRELAQALGYGEDDGFEQVLEKARTACRASGQPVTEHFGAAPGQPAKGAAGRRGENWLSRYACYLVIQNADPAREAVALGQTYFAIQTRRQELASRRASEEESRLLLRRELKRHNLRLASAARLAGIVEPAEFAFFQNQGYRGLYGGLDAPGLHRRKGLGQGAHILDHMGSTELAANLFRATQAEEKLRRDNIRDREEANRTHFEVGRRVRQTIEELGGTKPENLPVAEDIRKLSSRRPSSLVRE